MLMRHVATEIEGDEEGLPVPAGADVGEVDPGTLADINFDDGMNSAPPSPPFASIG